MSPHSAEKANLFFQLKAIAAAIQVQVQVFQLTLSFELEAPDLEGRQNLEEVLIKEIF